MSEEPEKPLDGSDADAQPTKPDPNSEPYRHPADQIGGTPGNRPQPAQ